LKQLLNYPHKDEWTPFQTHYFSENIVVPGTGTVKFILDKVLNEHAYQSAKMTPKNPSRQVDSNIREKKRVLFSSKMVAHRDAKIHRFLYALSNFKRKGKTLQMEKDTDI
jgi:hypothetical protein